MDTSPPGSSTSQENPASGATSFRPTEEPVSSWDSNTLQEVDPLLGADERLHLVAEAERAGDSSHLAVLGGGVVAVGPQLQAGCGLPRTAAGPSQPQNSPKTAASPQG